MILAPICVIATVALASVLSFSSASAQQVRTRISEQDFSTAERSSATAKCKIARDPVRCVAMMQLRQTCQNLRGAKKRVCWDDNMPPPDCSRAKDPVRCDLLVAAQATCKGRHGVEQRNCKREQRKTLGRRVGEK